MSINPIATRPLEYVAVFTFGVRTDEGTGHVFLAVDAYLDHVFHLGVELDRNPETVLKCVYFLMENPDFSQYLGKGFTLVFEEFQELESSIEAIIKPFDGKILFNKAFNNVLANPVLISLRETMLGMRKR